MVDMSERGNGTDETHTHTHTHTDSERREKINVIVWVKLGLANLLHLSENDFVPQAEKKLK